MPRPSIPPAEPPNPPEPPIPPEPPLRLSAAPVPPPIAPGILSTTEVCQGVPEVLQRFQRAYQSGALDPFMALYSPLAKENELATWFAIRQTYADWFRQTSARRITFDRLQVQPVADSDRCAAMAIFKVSYLDERALLATKAGVIEILFDRKGSELLILRVRY
ncbi:hypothetical protein CKO27_19800 [Thiocystis violacea]|nr:hypothetical protein [Thiocystis violacea]